MPTNVLIALIRLYQLTLSRLLGRVCRFEPSCSRYAIACLEGHGFVRGGLLSIRRVCKCHPFHPGGYDPPPPRLAQGHSPPPPLEATPHANAPD
jgi:putative membrane protein insertion efficiency factor